MVRQYALIKIVDIVINLCVAISSLTKLKRKDIWVEIKI